MELDYNLFPYFPSLIVGPLVNSVYSFLGFNFCYSFRECIVYCWTIKRRSVISLLGLPLRHHCRMAIQGNIRFPNITPYISTLFIGLRLRVNETEASVLLSILDYITQKLSLSLPLMHARFFNCSIQLPQRRIDQSSREFVITIPMIKRCNRLLKNIDRAFSQYLALALTHILVYYVPGSG